MNKQIKTLMGRALDKAVPYTWHSLDHVEVEKVMQEFAELLVSECLEVCRRGKYDRDDLSTIQFDSGIRFCMNAIGEHFGD